MHIKERFDSDGYVALDAVTTPEDVAQITALLDPLFDRFDSLGERAIELSGAHESGTPLRSPEINEPTVLAPALRSTKAYQRCKQIAHEILRAPAGYLFDHAIYKLPRSQAPTNWHQDHVYSRSPIAARAVHFWIPLQPATIQNGCMRYIPGSHRSGLVQHRAAVTRFAASSSREIGATLAIDGVDDSKAVACEIPAGGAAIHHPLTIHSAGPNLTDGYRRAWILHFGAYGRWRYRLHPLAVLSRFRDAFSSRT